LIDLNDSSLDSSLHSEQRVHDGDRELENIDRTVSIVDFPRQDDINPVESSITGAKAAVMFKPESPKSKKVPLSTVLKILNRDTDLSAAESVIGDFSIGQQFMYFKGEVFDVSARKTFDGASVFSLTDARTTQDLEANRLNAIVFIRSAIEYESSRTSSLG